jgi:putative transposase
MTTARYTSDLTDKQWELLEPTFHPLPVTGRRRKYSYREILNGCFYVVRTGCQWRNLPKDLPPWSIVYTYYRNWIQSDFWIRLHERLRQQVRYAAGRKLKPSAAILDSQSVKSTESSETRGFDAGKKVNGIKRHLAVDTLGLVLLVMVTAASTQDRQAAYSFLPLLFRSFGSIQLVWADAGYAGQLVEFVRRQFRRCLQIVKAIAPGRGFQVQPKRWIVERTFGWLGRYRRLSKNYERKTDTAEAVVYISMTHLMLRRLAK